MDTWNHNSRQVPAVAGGDVRRRCGAVDLWWVRLDVAWPAVAQCQSLLSEDEHQRAARFRFQADRRRFVVCRGLLRMILAERLALPPQRLVFQYGVGGKPGLIQEANNPPVYFNVSHTGDRALIALTMSGEIGVDAERVDRRIDPNLLAPHCFSQREQRQLSSLDPARRTVAFFQGWTRKEAYLKALGTGIGRPLADCEVTLVPGEPPRLVRDAHNRRAPQQWSFQAWVPEPGYVAALAVANERSPAS